MPTRGNSSIVTKKKNRLVNKSALPIQTAKMNITTGQIQSSQQQQQQQSQQQINHNQQQSQQTMMFFDSNEVKRPPSRGGAFCEKTREEIMMERKREGILAQEDARIALRIKNTGSNLNNASVGNVGNKLLEQKRPPCRQKEPNALMDLNEIFPTSNY